MIRDELDKVIRAKEVLNSAMETPDLTHKIVSMYNDDYESLKEKLIQKYEAEQEKVKKLREGLELYHNIFWSEMSPDYVASIHTLLKETEGE